ncbi:hypothetical protein HPB51_021472 [Rhipicephalus microplus]|uniref:Uncharacterized protein n=1 Tax=Rhipicephalus microplus TaxID=6941 RepID=A0A9J6DJI0_RHIMP|nr:hypothetical protein HPB51_021472 [Rhipicephalus microplus]
MSHLPTCPTSGCGGVNWETIVTSTAALPRRGGLVAKLKTSQSVLPIPPVNNRVMLLTCGMCLALGSFLTAGFADRPMVRHKHEPKKRDDFDDCCPFSRMFVTIVYNQRVNSPYRFLWLVLRHSWQEQVWSCAVAVMYYSSILLRIPLFHGLLAGGSTDMSFNKAVLLLVVSCATEGLVCSLCVSLSIRCQIRAQLLLQTAVFKKVTCLSAAAVAANPSGYVSSLLVADLWLLGLFTSFLANAFVGLLCIPLVLAALAYEFGYEPACACLVWILLVAAACAVMEPLLYKSCKVLYRFRDERLKKFTDFLLSIRPIKMSALEDVFQKSLLHLRKKEIDQAYRVNVLEMLLETLFSASSPMVYRSCKRVMSFFKEEEYSKEEAESRHAPNIPVGEVALKDCSFAWCKRNDIVDSPALDGVNLLVESGSLVGVVGTVGSGKSSLLSAIVGEMRHLSGSVSLNGSIAIVSQAPQILNMSLRDNITFGRKFDQLYYGKVVEACQLSRDINRMAAGDFTEAGDKGEMLSGGQKQRVALARAVYSRSDIYLLDDPTSSQDARVTKEIMRRVLGHDGILGNKFVKWSRNHSHRAVRKEMKEYQCTPTQFLPQSQFLAWFHLCLRGYMHCGMTSELFLAAIFKIPRQVLPLVLGELIRWQTPPKTVRERSAGSGPFRRISPPPPNRIQRPYGGRNAQCERAIRQAHHLTLCVMRRACLLL